MKDQSRADVCPVECIYEADDQLYIHPNKCINCGARVLTCSASAIFPEEDVPSEWEGFIQKNAELAGL
jgi:NAD-dependent dihydropyrimidine dehydrogenase PreA subunit